MISAKDTFKQNQLKYERVSKAYVSFEKKVKDNLKKHGISSANYDLFIRAYKAEDELELWAKNKSEKQYQKIRTFEICAKSGSAGPKRQSGDGQVPEGLYHIERYNPSSNFHLSLGINYPNASDKKISKATDLGGDIFIHGDCVTIGCMPLQDEGIKELYVYCIESNTQEKNQIPVYIFPCQLEGKTFEKTIAENIRNKDAIALWASLKTIDLYFSKYKQLPKWSIAKNGYYQLNQ
jgi:murein L,D-transpeptidase YafK